MGLLAPLNSCILAEESMLEDGLMGAPVDWLEMLPRLLTALVRFEGVANMPVFLAERLGGSTLC